MPIFIRSFDELDSIKFDEIFSEYKTPNVFEKCVTFLNSEPSSFKNHLPLFSVNKDIEIICQNNKEVFSITRLVNDRPGGPNKFIERKVGELTSTRNINTIIKILKKLR